MNDLESGKPLPGLGAVALQAGRHVGETIQLLLNKQPVRPFRYFNKGTMAQIGRGAGVVELPGGSSLTGPIAWIAWLGVHLSLLSGTEDKTSVFVDWGWNAITRKRANRTIFGNDAPSDPPSQAPAET
jgi:NADH dehydrogenase